MPAPELATQFLISLFGGTTTENVFLCSLPNARGGSPGEKRLLTRESEKIEGFVERWDQPGRSLFFCTGTIIAAATPERRGGSPRNKGNIAETPIAWADIDYKDIIDDAPEALAAVQGLMHPPSAIVASGHGLHLYWLLREAAGPDERPRLEALLRSLAELVAGDPAVCETARLMRLPGSTNSKDPGEQIPVEIVAIDSERRYEFADLEDMAATQAPILSRRIPVTRAAANPWLAAKERYGLKTPINVEERLAAMRHHGNGDDAIHATQRDVSAVLLNRGMPRDEVVTFLLEATAAALGEEAKTWDWNSEKRKLENMCDTWIPKSERAQEALAENERETAQAANGTDNVVNLADRRDKAKPPKAADKPNIPRIVADGVVEHIRVQGGDILLTGGGCHIWRDGMWWPAEAADNQWLKVLIQEGHEALGVAGGTQSLNASWKRLMEHPRLFKRDIAWDAHGMIPTLSGLVDPITGELHPAALERYATWRVDAEYDPTASCPLWADMIDEMFAERSPSDRRDTVMVIQELIGTALMDGLSRQLSKGMILHGGEDCGKSEVLKVISGLFGNQLITSDLGMLEGPHGLMEFAKRRPWVLHEAFQQGKWHLSAVVKSIVTHNPVSINMKQGAIYSHVVRAPIFWGTNHPPQFKELTRAIVSRFVIIACKQKFKEDAPVGVTIKARAANLKEPSELVLAQERAGILNWAIRGLQRALTRGWIEQTPEMRETGNQVRRDSNLVAGFIEDHVLFDPDFMVSGPDFCAAFQPWFAHHKGQNPRTRPTNESILRALAALGDQRIAMGGNELRDNKRRYCAGIKLDEDGLRMWEREKTSKIWEQTAIFLSDEVTQVNRVIPAFWSDRSSVTAMRRAQSAGDSMTDVDPDEDPSLENRHHGQPIDPLDDIPF